MPSLLAARLPQPKVPEVVPLVCYGTAVHKALYVDDGVHPHKILSWGDEINSSTDKFFSAASQHTIVVMRHNLPDDNV